MAITWLIHVVTYLLNTQLPLQIVALGGTHGQIGWLFAVNTGVAMVLRPQVGGWVDRYGARALMLAGAGVLVLTMAALNVAATPLSADRADGGPRDRARARLDGRQHRGRRARARPTGGARR